MKGQKSFGQGLLGSSSRLVSSKFYDGLAIVRSNTAIIFFEF